MTKCDGCINTGNAGNAGLDSVVKELETLYGTYGEDFDISRADFWALAAMGALNKCIEVANECYPKSVSINKKNLEFANLDFSNLDFVNLDFEDKSQG